MGTTEAAYTDARYSVHVHTCKHAHSVYSGLLLLTWSMKYAMKDLHVYFSGVFLVQMYVWVLQGIYAQIKSQYMSMATPFSVLPTGRTAMLEIPLSIYLVIIAIDM